MLKHYFLDMDMDIDMDEDVDMNVDVDISVPYHSGGSMKLNACILVLAHMVYL